MSTESVPTPRVCSVTDAIAVVGERHSLPIVRELLYGNRRFSEIADAVGLSRTLLSSRLRRLETAGVVERRRYSEHPPRDEYVLTEAGQALLPVLAALKEWGDIYCRDGIATTEFQHRCGAVLHTRADCAACGEEIRFEDLTVVGGTHPPQIRL
ncbi:helix-turn-helix domain-containing protein [Streptomyces sp. W16]|uniref:winged helix-turn-helix transcriptional regulator n=1 Tax=Streptomyces sp. W16 TaxID=3076631 RepID=UPI00295AC739|nr:helix-turn-helix domain-containing protein [Streptomyces sp. W16]MDV9168986.1 helix-turn-helix domain-containing protein [Streptomyces sp. W16]